MENSIHPTAIIEGTVSMGRGNVIGPYAILRGHITMGDFNRIEGHAVLENQVILGDHNTIYPFVSIGAIGEMGSKGDHLREEGAVEIGLHVTVREYVCIHAPVHTARTQIADHAYLMNKSYVAHDGYVGAGVTLHAGVLLGGQVHLEEGVTVGMGATIHQRCRIGAYSMIGMQTPITRDILPFAKVAGSPARVLGFNRIAASKLTMDDLWMHEMDVYFATGMSTESTSNPMRQRVQSFLAKYPGSLVKLKG